VISFIAIMIDFAIIGAAVFVAIVTAVIIATTATIVNTAHNSLNTCIFALLIEIFQQTEQHFSSFLH
jgi:hypothetical protein